MLTGLIGPSASAHLRTYLAAVLPSRCTIRAVTDTNGVQTWATIRHSDVPCQVGFPRQGGPLAMADYLGNEPGVVIWMPHDTDVRSGDRIEVDGRQYTVGFVPTVRSEELLRSVVCAEQRDPGEVT